MVLNGSRLGFYEPFRRKMNEVVGSGVSDQIWWVNLSAGATSGAVGGEWRVY